MLTGTVWVIVFHVFVAGQDVWSVTESSTAFKTRETCEAVIRIVASPEIRDDAECKPFTIRY